MDKKKLILQIVIGVVLYILISLILANDFSMETVKKESGEGLVFGIIFAVVLWLREQYKKRKSE